MRLGYNTNGLAHHDIGQAIELLAEIGYQSIAITVDQHVLNPFRPTLAAEVARVRECLRRYGMHSVIETGARYLLDPRTKHEPTLLSATAAERQRRIAFLQTAIDLARDLESDCVSLWSGTLRETIPENAAFERLVAGLNQVVDYARRQNVVLGFEPEPGMFIDTMTRFEQLSSRVGATELQLTLDVGHLHCLGEVPIDAEIDRWAERIVNVHIEDMRKGVHEHRMFGEGEMEFPPLLRAFAQIGYTGGLHVELSRHSHDGPRVAKQAFEFLDGLRTG